MSRRVVMVRFRSTGPTVSTQTVEIGAAGSSLTLTKAQSVPGTIQLYGGTLTDTFGLTVGGGAKLIGKGVVVGPISGLVVQLKPPAAC